MPAVVRLVHPAPTAAVVLLSAALGVILLAQVGRPAADGRLMLVILSVLGSQVMTGALNDWADRRRDALVQPSKPIPAGEASPTTAIRLGLAGGLLQVVASAPLGWLPLTLGVAAAASALAYNLWLSRTPASVLPYIVSFGMLPAWVAAGIDVDLARVAGASVLAGPFAAAAHLANTVRNFDADAAAGSRNLAQTLGRRTAFALAWGMAMAVGGGVGIGFAASGLLTAAATTLGLIGVGAVALGIAGPRWLWTGMLVAAVCWTAAWGLATG